MQMIDRDTERKTIAILKVLSESSEPQGSIAISRALERHGVFLSERAVRYHLRMTDERGYTEPQGRDGRVITQAGLEELRLALAPEQVGFIITAGVILLVMLWRFRARPLVAIACAIVLSPLLFYGFAHLLRVPLPHGWLGW